MDVRVADLSAVERLVGGVVVVEEEHVDEGDEEAGGVPGGQSIVRDPLVEDEDDQVAEQAGHEDDLRDEAQVDVERLVEIPAENHNRFIVRGEIRHIGTNWSVKGAETLTGG